MFEIRALFLVFLILFSLTSYSATYFVAPNGRDINPGTIDLPFFSLNIVWSFVSPGDTVYLRGGTYAYTTQQILTGKSGTADNLIKVWAYSNEKPVITRAGTGYGFAGYHSLVEYSGDYIHFKEISISGNTQMTNAVWSGLKVYNSSHNIFELLNIHHNGSGMSMEGDCNDNLILNCDFHHNSDPLSTLPYGNADGFSFSYVWFTGYANTIKGCRFWKNSDDGIDTWNNESLVNLDNCWSWGNGYILDSGLAGGDGNGYKWGGSHWDQHTLLLRVAKNCLAFYNRSNGFNINEGWFKVANYNCVAFHNSNRGFKMGDDIKFFGLVHIGKNNISYQNTEWNSEFTPTSILSNNTFLIGNGNTNSAYPISNADFMSIDTTGVSGVRQLDGSLPNLKFLKLASTSKLINAGTDVGIPFNDSAPDIGAFESGTDTAKPIITAFTIPATSTSLSVSISNIIASDNFGVTGYLLTESSVTPLSGATGWSSTKPIKYVFSTFGSKTLYAWAKDAVGNVSTSLKANVIISSPVATAFSLSGSTSGNVNTASGNFMVVPNNPFTGTITITLSGTGSKGLSAIVLTFSNSSVFQAFTITPSVAGSINLAATNDGGLINPENLTYTANAVVPGVPTSVIAIAGNETASVTFVAPANDGGLAISGYTVNSIPSGGTDTNAGKANLTHTIIGLTNGRSYTFTVKATNLVGTSLASKASKSVIIPVYYTEDVTICTGMNYVGYTTPGKYERKLTSVSGADSIITTYLTVNPKFIITEDIIITEGENYNGWTKSGQYSRVLISVSGCDSIVTTNLRVDKVLIKQGEIIPSHFIPVMHDENSQNQMNFIVISAILENLALTVDDEIGLYSGSVCVGAKKLPESINATDITTYLNIPVLPNNRYNNGFTNNDTIIVKIWDNKNQKEMLAKAVNYRNDMSSWLTSGRYSPNATSVVEIISYVEYTQSIELTKGYNMISAYVTAKNSNVSFITKSLCDQGNLIKFQDEVGNTFEKSGNFGAWINSLGPIKKTEGYKIKVANNCTLQITGRPIALPLDIPLMAGWNIISFPHIDLVDAMAVIQALIDQNNLLKVQDEVGNSIENLGIYDGWKNCIGDFVPGKAYKVKLNADAFLTLKQNYPKSATILDKSEKSVHFTTNIVGNGSDHMNINIVDLLKSGLSIGDELAAFDGELCVGSLKLTVGNFYIGSVSIIASFSEDNDNSGFEEGHSVQIKLWNSLSGKESIVNAVIIDGKTIYEKQGSVLIKINSLTTGIQNIQELLKIDIYPNPSRDNVNVRFFELPTVGSRIEIMDITGRKVVSREISNTIENFYLGQQPVGLYIVKTIIGSSVIINKLIINK
jgi:hypothetical protein